MSLICYARKYDVELIIRLILNIFTPDSVTGFISMSSVGSSYSYFFKFGSANIRINF